MSLEKLKKYYYLKDINWILRIKYIKIILEALM